MNGNVFECDEEQDDHLQYYSKTVEFLDGYTKTKNLTFSIDLAPVFTTPIGKPVAPMPEAISEDADKLTEMIFQEEVRACVKRKNTLESNLATVYAVAWGQCSDDMKARLKTHDGYEVKSATHDCVWLLQQIKSEKMQYDESTDSFVSLLEALYSFSACKQNVGQSAEDYAERLVGWWETLEAHGGVFAPSYKLIKERDSDGNLRTAEQQKKLAVE